MRADLEALIAEPGLSKHHAFMTKVARPTVEIVPSKATSICGGSKFGGSPDVPAEFEWPEHDLGPYRFIGQFNLANVPPGSHGLPASGLLSFFYAHDDDGESNPSDPNFVRAYLFDTAKSLKSLEPPKAVRMGGTVSVTFELGMDVPPWPWDKAALESWPIEEAMQDAYWDLRTRLHPSRRYLLGYPFNTTLGYDPTPGPEWRSLLTLSSDSKLGWCWNDDDWLVAFVETDQLKAGDFSKIKADAG